MFFKNTYKNTRYLQ